MQPRWHSRGNGYEFMDISKGTIRKGDFANLPGGESALGEIVAIYLQDGQPVASILWQEDGSIYDGISIGDLRVIA